MFVCEPKHHSFILKLAFVATFGLEPKCFCACGMSTKHGLIMQSKRLLAQRRGQKISLLLEASCIPKIVHFMQNLFYGQQFELLATNYFDSARFCEHLKEHWLQKARMWCIGNQNIPHLKQNTNAIVESFHINMKNFLYFSRERLTRHKMDWLIYNLVGDVLTHYWSGCNAKFSIM
jgi:hypothetical protein